ncbi:DotA/TraY family protein [Phaeobacter inhibens]|uniref:DotA/TraY family protein n=1 Tax=Phaeobacter inhibens TaxID=221822 RepID=UPI0021A92FED|nr:DotA/TraY family protein [Phaeobacter inhibens]UWR57085.1 DotA/TraY family protein [Phaeobacter inhibens]
MPRIRSLGLHFGHFAYLIALVLNSARLIPQGHPALNSSHIGAFGVRQVLAVAANHITWSKNNIDQIAIFGAVVAGIIMIAIQAVLIAIYAFLGTAHASSGFFTTPADHVQTDVVLIFLEQVFGPNLDFFGAASQPLGTPVYAGLHAVLALYSTATMVIAVIIVVYFIMTVVGEAAQSGTPFGKRFDTLWAPIRLVVALGLLVPLASGLNSAQYITLWMAKMGSGLGTVVWTTFVEEVTAATDIVAKPTGESTAALTQRVFLNEVCTAAFNQIEDGTGRSIKILQVTGRRTSVAPNFANPDSMVAAARNAGMENVVLSWSSAAAGTQATDYSCGKMSISLAEFDAFTDGTNVTVEEESWWWGLPLVGRDMDQKLGTVHTEVKNAYISEIKRLSDAFKPAGEAIAKVIVSVNAAPEYGKPETLDFISDLLRNEARNTNRNVNTVIASTYEDITQSEYASSGGYDEMVKRGWGAAGLWYGTLGTINKKYMDAVASAIPTLDVLFEATEVTENERGALGWLFGLSRYDVSHSATSQIEQAVNLASDDFMGAVEEVRPEVNPLYQDASEVESSRTWYQEDQTRWLGNAMIWMLGGSQIRHMQNNPELDPMVRLTSTGHTMVTRSLIFAGVGTALGLGGAVASAAPDPRFKFVGELAGAAAGLLFVIAGIAITAGIFLAYILPIIPFVYFAFAVIGWILEIFEAIVAMPLWAIAHLRIEAGGMPGQAALGGYQLLLMILLRPALIVIGLIGGYVIFGAASYFFGTLFNSATSITQSDIANNSIGAIGVFVYTIIFTFLIYNIALMCFKMIDDVPKGIMRWMGSSAQPFSDSKGDPIEGSRAMVAAGAGAAIGLASSSKGMSQGIQKARQRNQMRKSGIDPDNPVQQVQVVGGGDGGGSGGSGSFGTPQDFQNMLNRNPKGPTSNIADRPAKGSPKDPSSRFDNPRAAGRFFDNKDSSEDS